MSDEGNNLNSGGKSPLRFTSFSSFVNSSFWFKFCDLKLNEDMLNEVTRHLWGYYSFTEKTGSLMVDYTSFNEEFDAYSTRSYAHGYHINTNTIEKFKDLNKNDLLTKYGEELMTSIENGEALEDPSKLVFFIVLTFCDLKKYTFAYWFAFPAILDHLYLLADNPVNLDAVLTADQVKVLIQLFKKLPEKQKGFFCFELRNSEMSVSCIKDFVAKQEKVSENTYFAFLDPTTLEHIPGWPLRNFLSLLKIRCVYSEDVFMKPLKIVSIRGEFSNWINRSIVFSVQLSEKLVNTNDKNKVIGWEKNSKGKLSPRQVNLASDMDPAKLASRAVDLNLKLVKWRLQPDLNLSAIKKISCLLLGAGTLGCSVARVLLAWGVEKITFVDSGIVSYSNPARQSLFTFEDAFKCVPKASAAASALKRIHPGVMTTGHVLPIAMPGHIDFDLNHIRELEKLVEEHDVVFLLTDSRESRWLPTLLCSTKHKIAITIALGYDSYLVIRHGLFLNDSKKKLGCYFCNDVVAPGNSQIDRTLDQQCTVTRPGLSGIAASFGVELMISVLQHPKKGLAESNDVSCLGKIPHSIRGFISDYEHMFPSTPAFNQCIACSSMVIDEFRNNGDEFLKKVFTDAKYLEKVTALFEYELINDEVEFPELSDTEDY